MKKPYDLFGDEHTDGFGDPLLIDDELYRKTGLQETYIHPFGMGDSEERYTEDEGSSYFAASDGDEFGDPVEQTLKPRADYSQPSNMANSPPPPAKVVEEEQGRIRVRIQPVSTHMNVPANQYQNEPAEYRRNLVRRISLPSRWIGRVPASPTRKPSEVMEDEDVDFDETDREYDNRNSNGNGLRNSRGEEHQDGFSEQTNTPGSQFGNFTFGYQQQQQGSLMDYKMQTIPKNEIQQPINSDSQLSGFQFPQGPQQQTQQQEYSGLSTSTQPNFHRDEDRRNSQHLSQDSQDSQYMRSKLQTYLKERRFSAPPTMYHMFMPTSSSTQLFTQQQRNHHQQNHEYQRTSPGSVYNSGGSGKSSRSGSVNDNSSPKYHSCHFHLNDYDDRTRSNSVSSGSSAGSSRSRRRRSSVNQYVCCLKGCDKATSNRTRFCLKMPYEMKIIFASYGMDKICDSCYFKDRYRWQKLRKMQSERHERKMTKARLKLEEAEFHAGNGGQDEDVGADFQ